MSKLYTKVCRKLSRIIEHHIPYNQSYKPTGIYKTLSDYVNNSSANHAEVYPPEKSILKVPHELLKNNKNHIFTPLKGVQPAASVTAINQGRLCTDGTHFAAVISEDNKLIGDISLQVGTTDPEKNGIFEQSYFTTPLGLKGNVFNMLIGGSGENNYFHWMVDSLPRLHLLEKAGWLNKIDWFVVPTQSLPFQKDTLRLLGINTTKIVEGHSIGHFQADTLFASTFVRNIEHIPSWACQFLRDKFLPTAQKIINSPKRIYISRQDSDVRNVANEPEVVELLNKYGFQPVVLSDFTFSEQVALFASAEFVVSPHGAGLTNLVFCQKGTQVIELFAQEYTPVLYADLASKVRLNYSYLQSYTHPVAQTLREAMHKSIHVQLDKLKELVEESLIAEPQLSPDDVPSLKVV
ncbi:hypothetical protein ABID22_002970 [Pontibacter aydingkolensis]|uniref:Glycosyltransferase family 61 protein n=1 Tax=Pontibacter aydingkolensis TaxID=1911536 RepID=A0ABS7CVJ5_9BACT|nr:glycosyltransferase family 61 protein [Pontibacter aydingkolensis]MBW7467517.1 glycosyltransferase family 61 protein [Pontibacter aydingkolensis]